MCPLHKNSRKRLLNSGFSLVEVMVAVALSLMLMMGVIALFVSSRANYETTERLSRITENGRFALDQIVGDIREAGFQGCARPPQTARAVDYSISTLTSPSALLWNFAVPVQGFQSNRDGSWSPAIDPLVASLAPHDVSDVLVLRVPVRDAVALRLATAQAVGSDPLNVPMVPGATIAPGDVAVITDCEARAFFEVTTYSGNVMTHTASGRNSSADLRHRFAQGAEIVPMTTVIYYVAPSSAGIDATLLSLWRRIGTNAAEELAEGIERLEVQYGVDTNLNGRVDVYRTADAINWADPNVLSVRVAILARSPEPYGTDRDPEIYTLLERTETAFNDRHQRQIFTSTIALRNQVID